MIYTLFIQQLFFALFALLLTYSIGKSIASFIKITGGFFFKLFIIYSIGIIVILLFYSIIKAHGRTVNILLLPSLTYFVYYYKKSFTTYFTSTIDEISKELFWSIIPFLLVFIYQSLFYFNFSKGTVNPLFIDTYNYGSFCDSLKLYGIENRKVEMLYFYKEMREVIPYHYPELWLTAFFSQTLQMSSVNTYHFITFSLLVAISILGIASFFEKSFYKKYIILLLSIPLLFLFAQTNWIIVSYFGQKMCFVYIFFLLSFYELKCNNWLIGFLNISIIPIFSITLLPAIFCSLFFLFLFILKNKKYNLKETVQAALFIFCNSLLIILFYTYFTTSETKGYSLTITQTNLFKGVTNHLAFNNFKIVILNFICYILPSSLLLMKSVIISAYLFLLLFFKSLKQYILLLILVIILIFGGVLTTKINSHLFDANQFFDSIKIIEGIFIIVLLSESVFNKHYFASIGIGIAYCLILLEIPTVIHNNAKYTLNNDIDFAQKASKLLKTDNCVILSFITPKVCENNINFSHKKLFLLWVMANDLFEITQFTNKTIIFTIANPELQLSNERMSFEDSITYYKLTPINVWKSKGINHNLQTFIEQYNIKYFYFKQSIIIPHFIAQNIDTMIESPITHSKFIRIRK